MSKRHKCIEAHTKAYPIDIEIEGKAFMVVPHDEAKPKIVSEVLSSSVKEQWKKKWSL